MRYALTDATKAALRWTSLFIVLASLNLLTRSVNHGLEAPKVAAKSFSVIVVDLALPRPLGASRCGTGEDEEGGKSGNSVIGRTKEGTWDIISV